MWTMVRSFGPADPADAPIGLLAVSSMSFWAREIVPVRVLMAREVVSRDTLAVADIKQDCVLGLCQVEVAGSVV